MKTHIGIITSSMSLRNFQETDPQMREVCDITYLPYSSMMELTNLYMENAEKFDGILFSGSYPYDYITQNICRINKPFRCLDLADRDIYLLIARLYTQNPKIDFNRVVFDGNSSDLSNAEIQLFFEDVFPPQKMPQIKMLVDDRIYSQNLSIMYDAVLEEYRERWKTGTVDLFITRMSNMARQLEWEGIPHVLLQPCPATIMDCFRALLNDIQSARMEKSLTACCMIQISHKDPNQEEFDLLGKILENFNSEQNKVFVLRKNGMSFEAVTSVAAVRNLTSDYTTCLLTSFLHEMLPFSTSIGWGAGYDIITAHKNALQAIRKSKQDPHRYTYMINESDEVIGPLCGDRTISYPLKPNMQMGRIAKKLGISPINLEKIASLRKNKHMTDFSASDLVFYLDITHRSATRILKKLEQNGAATQVNSLNLNGRGRPAAIYRVDLDKMLYNECQ